MHVAATVLLVARVGMHRLLFRHHRLSVLVSAAHRCVYAGPVLLGLALVGVTMVIFGAVAGRTAAFAASGLALAAVARGW